MFRIQCHHTLEEYSPPEVNRIWPWAYIITTSLYTPYSIYLRGEYIKIRGWARVGIREKRRSMAAKLPIQALNMIPMENLKS